MKLGIRVMDLMRMCFGFVHNSIHKNIEILKDIINIVKLYLYNNLLFDFS
jgi:hypothetical protein